eukprot:TRINITY_DN27571_c0_g2_i5.p1 TRINITY_DN27571_c0_g2~~TRINITY_DN27571_c0_g2_i5.p1  ORF type:complete len:339 (+),score=25.60 TRINITY_DN27571_c0_g2_i5:342-1358(+)
MSARHLNYLREKSLVVSYSKGDILFSPPRSKSMGYYLLEGKVEILIGGDIHKEVQAETSESYCSLEEELPDDACAIAMEECRVLQLSRVLVEQYFSWSTTGEYRVVDVNAINQSVEKQRTEWMQPLLHSPLAKNLSETRAKELFDLFEECRVREHDIIMHKGESNQFFYVLKNGAAKIVLADDEEKNIGVGDFFGDESLVPDAASSIQVEMTSPGVVAKLEKQHFNNYIKNSLINYVDLKQLELMDRLSYTILDVRFPAEYKTGHVEESINIPVSALRRRLSELNTGLVYMLSIESGARGELAAYILQQEGFRAFVLEDKEARTSFKLHGQGKNRGTI